MKTSKCFLATVVTMTLTSACSAADVTYLIATKTGNKNGDGTDADVNIKLVGTKGETGWMNLDNEGDDRERGDIDLYFKEAKDVGPLTKIKIRTREEPKKNRPDWGLEWVIVGKVEKPIKTGVYIDGWSKDVMIGESIRAKIEFEFKVSLDEFLNDQFFNSLSQLAKNDPVLRKCLNDDMVVGLFHNVPFPTKFSYGKIVKPAPRTKPPTWTEIEIDSPLEPFKRYMK